MVNSIIGLDTDMNILILKFDYQNKPRHRGSPRGYAL